MNAEVEIDGPVNLGNPFEVTISELARLIVTLVGSRSKHRHSWELQEMDQWQRLDEVLRFISLVVDEAASLTNGQLCRRSLSGNIGGE
jgi:hypothetical protein